MVYRDASTQTSLELYNTSFQSSPGNSHDWKVSGCNTILTYAGPEHSFRFTVQANGGWTSDPPPERFPLSLEEAVDVMADAVTTYELVFPMAKLYKEFQRELFLRLYEQHPGGDQDEQDTAALKRTDCLAEAHRSHRKGEVPSDNIKRLANIMQGVHQCYLDDKAELATLMDIAFEEQGTATEPQRAQCTAM